MHVSTLTRIIKPTNTISGLNLAMETLKERLEEVMREMRWEHRDVVRISEQSSSVVSQWLGKGSKQIKSIGKLDAALKLEAQSGFSALWIAKGQGPKRLHRGPTQRHEIADSPPPPYGAAAVLRQLQALLQTVDPDMLPAFADVLAGWARAGGADDRIPALLALLSQHSKVSRAA